MSTSDPCAPARTSSTPRHRGSRRRTPLLRLLAAPVLVLAVVGASLVVTSPAQARSSYIVVARGDSGSQVTTVQRYLDVRPVSGYFGPRTQAAVKRWQRNHHRRVTGMVGKRLYRAATGRPAARTRPAVRSRSVSRSGDRVEGLDWRALAHCESGGRPGAVNPAGYYGLYQFSPATWRSVGGSGMPHRASAGEQTNRAQTLFRRSGSSPWPNCGKHLFG